LPGSRDDSHSQVHVFKVSKQYQKGKGNKLGGMKKLTKILSKKRGIILAKSMKE
jgi:hypothetical protein